MPYFISLFLTPRMLNFIKSKCGLVIFFPLEILLVSWIFFCILYFRYGLFIFLPFYIKNSSPNSEVFDFVVGLYLALLQYWIIIVLICIQWSSETITMGFFFFEARPSSDYHCCCAQETERGWAMKLWSDVSALCWRALSI